MSPDPAQARHDIAKPTPGAAMDHRLSFLPAFPSRLTRPWRLLAATALVLAATTQSASAQEPYPNRPIKIVVGFSAGGSTDVIARLVAKGMSEQLGQPVIVENRAGAGGGIALESVAKAAPDGYTLLLLTASSTTLGLVRKVPFDLERDFIPISQIAVGPMVMAVSSSTAVRKLPDLIAKGKEPGARLSYGTSGAGTPSHLAGVLLERLANVQATHIPFKGSSENIIATASGEVTMSFTDAVSTIPMLQSGKAIALGVTTAKRASFLPDVPTLEEAGLKGMVLPLFFGVGAPTGTPPQVISRLHAVISKTVSAPEMKEPFNKLGVDPQVSTPAEFKAFLRSEVEKNAQLIKASGIKVE
jgi:tripartite-type tricarboxylate transporter receptor subunit TctC